MKTVRKRPAPAKLGNKLLAALDSSELKLLQPHLEPVALAARELLFRPQQEITHVYFITGGTVSTLRDVRNGEAIAVANTGSEGMVGTSLVLGARTAASRLVVQVEGNALRVARDPLCAALEELPGLRRLLTRYALAAFRQVMQTAACNGAHPVDERCAKWLLLTQDRTGKSTFALPQELLAQLLAVLRPTAALAAGMLQKAGVITYIRGVVTILDRAGLEAASCACYRVIVAEYDNLLRRAT